MENRIQFKNGKQREFLDIVKDRLAVRSLRALLQFGISVPYSALKCYYSEHRLLPQTLFENLCHLAKISPHKFEVIILNGNWGQVKGGKRKH
ncbi:hypothetical protein J4456_04190 [Candidatus Pacearchaeota archaeon]|nr:hypothetical protein [uncultured archaeon]AQS29428.1 hypothetical protein [uncultured archaeon]AQS34056.1 hypothetical protein [uncultured archaeon]MBS3093750.1 hypothetical protein [Candidatus Pacearchaeota archaeon]